MKDRNPSPAEQKSLAADLRDAVESDRLNEIGPEDWQTIIGLVDGTPDSGAPGKDDDRTPPEGGSKDLQRVQRALFEPIAPSLSSTLTTLISVSHGVALATLVIVIESLFFSSDAAPLNSETVAILVAKLLIVFLMICLVWQRYVTHAHYYVYNAGISDPIIPLGFMLSQCFLALSASTNVFYFALWVTSINVFGVAAYLNTRMRGKNQLTEVLFRAHYEDIATGLAKFVLDNVRKYEKRALCEQIALTVVWGTLTAFSWFRPDLETEITWAVIALATISLPYLLFFDFRHQMRSSGGHAGIEWP